MLNAKLDAAGNILTVHYRSMKCDVSFSWGRWGRHVTHV